MKNVTLKTLTSAFLCGVALLAATSSWAAQTVNLRAEKFIKTFTLPDGTTTNVEMWGFALDAAPPTVPGPALTIPPGETELIIQFVNNLDVPASLVIPGQNGFVRDAPHATFTDAQGRTRARSLVKETSGGGGTGQYRWTNLLAGTYLYQSGSQAALQVQMGLYGMLKRDAIAGQAYGNPYSQEAVWFFSEVDLDVHAAVQAGTYGDTVKSMIHSVPELYLLNGEPYQVGELAMTPGQTYLVRLLNACYDDRIPVLHGAHATMIAEDGRKYPYPKLENAILLTALKTRDALLTNGVAGSVKFFDRRILLTANVPAQPVVDTTPPTLVSATASSATTVTVLFSEPVVPATGNYTINRGVTVSSRAAGADARTVVLTTSPLLGGAYTLTVNGVSDLAGNAIAANSQVVFTFVPPRVATDLVVFYDFHESSGTIVHDVSGVGTPLDLVFTNATGNPTSFAWLAGGGVRFTAAGSGFRSPGAGSKVISALTASDRLTIEAWVAPANITQNNARIVAVATNQANALMNVHMAQLTTSANFRTRTSGNPNQTQSVAAFPNTALRHIVMTYDSTLASNPRKRIYVDGVQAGTGATTGTLDNWDTSYPLVLGNVPSLNSSWLGDLRLVAIYGRALSASEVQQNFYAGPAPQP